MRRRYQGRGGTNLALDSKSRSGVTKSNISFILFIFSKENVTLEIKI